ncbi:MAG: glycosyltransferase family 4 protein [Kiritimatiellia bacterium]
MKILMMVLHFPPAHRGGAELQCWKQAKALAARGHDVTVLTEWLWGSSPRREIRDGVIVRRMGAFLPVTAAVRRVHRWLRLKLAAPSADRPDPFSADQPLSVPERERTRFRWMSAVEWLGQLSFILEAGWAVKRGSLTADVVHVHESHWLAGFGHWVGEQLHAPVLCKEACGDVLLWQGGGDIPWRTRWKRRRTLCRFIAVTPQVRRELEKAGISSSRIADVPNGVEIPPTPTRPEEHTLAVYAGNFSQGAVYKAFDVLFRAWGRVHREEPSLRLRLFGAGGMERWRQVAEMEGCGESVEFAGPSANLQAEFCQAGFLVLPSRVEGLSNVLLEAQAAGLPAVVSDIGGNVAVVRDGENGCVVSVGDDETLAAAIVEMARNPARRAEMGRAARARIAAAFALDHIAIRLEDVYRQAVEQELAARAAGQNIDG